MPNKVIKKDKNTYVFHWEVSFLGIEIVTKKKLIHETFRIHPEFRVGPQAKKVNYKCTTLKQPTQSSIIDFSTQTHDL